MNPMALFGNDAPAFNRPPEPPNLPLASPLLRNDVYNPVRFPNANNNPNAKNNNNAMPMDKLDMPGGFPPSNLDAPILQTPALSAHQALQYPGRGGSIDFGSMGGSSAFGGDGLSLQGHGGQKPFSDIFGWSWECGSEVGSVPSIWSKASTAKSQQSTGFSGDGQRLIFIKPQEVKTEKGGTVVIGLKKEIPEQYWNHVEILLVGGVGEAQIRLKPSGIRKGKKLCIKVPPNLECRDYDVRVVFAGKILHGAIPLAVRGEDESEEEEES